MPPHRAHDAVLPELRRGPRGGLQAGPVGRAGEDVMATAVARYCGRCGAVLPPGAGFCGRCGTPVLAQQAFAPPPPGPPPVYQYARAPLARYTTGEGKLAPALIAGGLVVVLLVVAVVIGGFAIAQF